jgi:hypothetical protein
MRSSKSVLLTGAGFTHNFGAPLASELWAKIVNHEAVQAAPRVRQVVLSDLDFESGYHEIMSSDYSSEEKAAMARAVDDAYGYVDQIVRSWGFRPDAPYPVNVCKVQELISLFAGTNTEPGFFFTLNQDLFVERHYYQPFHERPQLPGIQPHRDWFTPHFREPVERQDYVTLPGSDAVRDEVALFEQATFYYLKLHGSCNWRAADGSHRMVIGRGKAAQINDEPLLAEYFEVFTRVLFEGNRRLLVIGYGFGDPHVNSIIGSAVENHELRLFVMTPESPVSLHDRLSQNESGEQIWSGLGGYFQWPLVKMFPGDQSETAEWQDIKTQYFQGRLRRPC